jgi:hypothetical protein
MQLIATIAIARMLHHSRYAEPEKLVRALSSSSLSYVCRLRLAKPLLPVQQLLALADKYVTPYSLSADSMSLEEHQQMMEIIYVFFQKVSLPRIAC